MKNFKQYLNEALERQKGLADIEEPYDNTFEAEFFMTDVQRTIQIVFVENSYDSYEVTYRVDGTIGVVYDIDPFDGIKILEAVLNVCMDFMDMFPDKRIIFYPASAENRKAYNLLGKYRTRIEKMGYVVEYKEHNNGFSKYSMWKDVK